MARLYEFAFVLEILLTVLALISCLSAEEGEIRALPRIVWVILILLFPLVGSIVYFAAGRPVKATPAGQWRPGSGFPEAERPARTTAPDDDPAFLKAIDAQKRRSDEELLRRWEEDLRRREDELRKREDSPPSDG
jgi:hypothetical protein